MVTKMVARIGSVLGVATALVSGTSWAAVPKEPRSSLDQKAFFRPELYISSSNLPLEEALAQLPNRAAWETFLAGLAETPGGAAGFIDPRSGAATNLIVAIPLIPGSGVGNDVTLSGLSSRLGRAVVRVDEQIVGEAVLDFVKAHHELLGVDVGQLGPVRARPANPDLWHVTIPQSVGGVPVRHGHLVAAISHGNLVVIGTETWGNAHLDVTPRIGAEEAFQAGFAFADGREVDDHVLREPALEVVPFAPPEHQDGEAFAGPIGAGYGHRLVWTFAFRRPPDLAEWEVMVDAFTGELIAFEDKNHYVSKQATGGVYPLTSTGVCPTPQTCGTMQLGWPMPWADIGVPNSFANSAGVFDYTGGTATSTLTGRFVRINDACGPISLSSPTGDLLFGGAGDQHDCTTPGVGGAGNTAAARSCFYELNKLAEQARGYLPSNTWLLGSLGVNVNMSNQTCNANYSPGTGSLNFFRSGAGCRNTGEIAEIFDHEWGHGLDDNDTGGSFSNSSETYADIAANYRLQASCIGHGFVWTLDFGCGMTLDGTGFNAREAVFPLHCDTDCSGVRDADWAKHNPNTPDTALGFVCSSCASGTGPCGRSVHCGAVPSSQAAWDFVARDLRAAPFNLDSQTAFIVGNKVFYQGSGLIGSWHSCTCGGSSDGCGATNGYMQWITADDDNGNLFDGTPHMTALHAAFNRHGIACAGPAPTNSGCSGGPATAPTLNAAAGNGQATLSWNAVTGATRYWVYRTEGHAGCDFGKALIAEVTGLTYTDTQVANGRPYFYNVVAAGASSACYSRASNCATATPSALANFNLSCSPSALSIVQGGSRTSTCTVQSVSDFASAVDLSCASLPAGVACGYNPPSITPPSNGTATTALTVSVGLAVPAGNYSFQAQGVGGALTRTFNMTLAVVACPAITVNPATVPGGTAGSPYSQTFTQTGGTAPATFGLAGTLPSGVTFDAGTATISGTPTQTGSFNFTVTATDANGCLGSRGYTLVVSCQAITVNPTTIPSGTAGSPYSQTFTQSGGIGAISWSLTGTLPTGLSLNTSTGVLSGTPTQTGSFNITVTATDANGCLGSRSYTLVVNCQAITVNPTTIPSGTASSPYSQTFTQSGGIGTITWSLTGTLPTGLTLNTSTGVLSGTPTQTGNFNITVTATDANGCLGSRSYTLAINCQTITVNPATIPSGTAGSPYSQTFTQSGGFGTITWSLIGTLPTGLTLNTSTGVLSGTPTQMGSFNITVTATDANGCLGSRSYTLVINCQTITVNPTAIPTGTAGSPYSQTFTQSGGIGTITWSLTGTLPTGLTLNTSTGVLSGTPTQMGSFNITVTAADANGCLGSRSYLLVINCQTITVNPTTIPSGTAGSPYSQTFTQSGGNGTITWSLIGTLPTGLSLNTSTGALSGTPTQTGSFPITVISSDANGCFGSRTYVLVVNCQTITVNPATIPAGTAGSPYSQTFTQSGGFGTVTWSLTGTLPTGLSLNTSTGVLSGTPTQTGSFNITVTATDANGCLGSRSYTLVINCQAITVNPTTIPSGTAGSPYSQTFAQSGGIGTITWSLTGTLPTGLSFNTSTGALSGTPTQTGSFNITVTATDANGCLGSRSYTLVVNCQTITVNPATIPAGTAGSPYSQTFMQTGGIGAITWSLTGTLPTGLSLNTSTGVLSGTPTQAGSFNITVTATDANGCTGSRAYALVIDRAGPFAPTALIVDQAGNRVLEAGEVAVVAPSWRNDTGAPETVTGTASNFTGPGTPIYTITDANADYGLVPAGATATCSSPTGNCYGLSISVPNPRPTLHWDSTVRETLSNGDARTWTLHVGASFSDVPTTSGFYRFVETLLHRGVTGGCGPETYCTTASTARAQMAVFVLVAKEGVAYQPPACTTPMFPDVPASSPFCRWIEELARRGVAAGCGGGQFCPTAAVTREQVAVFVLRTLDPTLDPPACTTPMFGDVPASSPFCRWIEELARRGVVTGCGGGNYCPTSAVTREQMAVFITVTFDLTLYGP